MGCRFGKYGDAKRRKIPQKMLWHLAKNVIKSFFNKNGILNPYFATYYLTLRCNFFCSFCDDGSLKKYPDIPYEELNTEDTKKVLKILRNDCPSIYFTGGEPTLRNDIVELCKYSKEIGFQPVSVNTNGSLIHRCEEMLDHIDNLVISLNSLDTKKYSKMVGVKGRLVKRVLENIVGYAQQQNARAFRITINCVVNEQTISDTPALMEFCFANNVSFSLVPRVTGHYPDAALGNNPDWKKLVDYVLEAKRQKKPIFNSPHFLSHIRDFKTFDCNPTVVPHIYPSGEMFYPCQQLKHVAGNLLEISSYRRTMAIGKERIGPIPECDNRCHLACYMESSLITKQPFRSLMNFIPTR